MNSGVPLRAFSLWVGIAAALSEQIEMFEDLAITEDEIAFLRRKSSYIPS